MVRLPVGFEHRWGERIRVNLPVDVVLDGNAAMPGTVKNLSLSGALLNSTADLPLHALIAVRIEVAPPSQDMYVIKARVCRKPGHAIGIEWCEFAPPAVKDLLRSSSGSYRPDH
jgi:hypothetical protein